MGVFDDRKFEELDWLSQATEPIESKLNDLLSKLPEETVIDYDIIVRSMRDSYFSNYISKAKIVNVAISGLSELLNYKEEDMLLSCFILEVEHNTAVDFEAQTLHGSIILRKTKNLFEDKDLEKILGYVGLNQVNSCSIYDSDRMSRANEVMDVLGLCEDGLKTRSGYTKRKCIVKRLNDIYSSNEWKIRDTELANKVGFWISEYIAEGNLAAFSNFCKMKVMTHKGLPIYSMEETV